MIEGLFPKARTQILTLLFSNPDGWFYNRQIKEKVGVGQGAAQRELGNLWKNGIIIREKRGNQVYYRANRDNPIFNELRMLILKTSGLADHFKNGLDKLKEKIAVAFIYGSIAKGTYDSDSDIDIMIIGDLKFDSFVKPVSLLEKKIGREINPTVYPAEEFRKKAKSDHHFVSSVLKGDKIFIIGDEDELRRIIE